MPLLHAYVLTILRTASASSRPRCSLQKVLKAAGA